MEPGEFDWSTECNVCHGTIPHSNTREEAVVKRDIHVLWSGHEYNDIDILLKKEWIVVYDRETNSME